MSPLHYKFVLFAVILIEGYIVLASEMLAIRLIFPFVGSGTDTFAIVIASVLMPLAVGYQAGGAFKPFMLLGRRITTRRKLILNLIIAAAILLPALSFSFILDFFLFIEKIGIRHRSLQAGTYGILFLMIPVYLLGQTVPLVMRYFSKQTLPRMSGIVLFVSTIGSFLGAVFSTLFLMSKIGVHHTVTLNFMLFAALVIMLTKHKTGLAVKIAMMIFMIALYLNSNFTMRSYRIVKNNNYNTISVRTIGGDNNLFINGNYSSKFNPQTGRKHEYIEFAERIAINPTLEDENLAPKEILIVGAGGFTIGHHDRKNNYTFLDIDPDLLEVAEKLILKEKLSANKTFIPQEARAYLAASKKKFDFIYLDAYLGGVSIPEHLVTQEFFMQVKGALSDDGVMIANFIASPNFSNVFSRSLDNTLRSVFPHISRHVIQNNFDSWSENPYAIQNIAYIYKQQVK